MSAINRVRSLLRQIDKRGAQGVAEQTRNTRGDKILAQATMGLAEASHEEVTIKGTGRAIEKVLRLAAWFGEREKEEGVKVKLTTGSLTAIDDIIVDDDDNTESLEKNTSDETTQESRTRQISVLEAKILLR